MRKLYLFSLALVCALCLPVAALGASVCQSPSNLVKNCGFEAGSFKDWSVSGNLQGGTPNAPSNQYTYVDNSGFSSYSGTSAGAFGATSQYAQNGNGTGNKYGPVTALSQAINVLPGVTYNVIFYLDTEGCSVSDGCPGYYNSFAVSFNGTSLFSDRNLPNSSGYQLNEFQLTTAATGNSGLLEFDFTNDSDLFYLDDVTIASASPTPEPSSLLLLGTGLAGLVGAAKRRFPRG